MFVCSLSKFLNNILTKYILFFIFLASRCMQMAVERVKYKKIRKNAVDILQYIRSIYNFKLVSYLIKYILLRKFEIRKSRSFSTVKGVKSLIDFFK